MAKIGKLAIEICPWQLQFVTLVIKDDDLGYRHHMEEVFGYWINITPLRQLTERFTSSATFYKQTHDT
jgi:hypothetical protein